MIAAEVRPAEGKAALAARELQRAGFRIHHVGDTVSVDADETLWTTVFKVRFQDVDRSGASGTLPAQGTYRRMVAGTLRIPAEFEPLIDDVAFIEPPDFFRQP